MHSTLIQLSDHEVDQISGGAIVVLGGTMTNLSGSNGAGSVSLAILGQTASFGGINTVAVGTIQGPTGLQIG